jgi:hypothetical protein
MKLIAVFLIVACGAAAAAGAPEYAWKPGDVLRYQYTKSVLMNEDSDGKNAEQREFEFDAVLILEIKSKSQNGVMAILRFDSPRVSMPDYYWFSSQGDAPLLQKDKGKAVSHAIEGAIKTAARWNVYLDNSGYVRIDSRVPNSLETWLKEEGHSAGWRTKFNKMWVDIIENNLGLKSTGEDREIFVSLNAPPASVSPEMDLIRPLRSSVKLLGIKDYKADYAFTRVAPPKAGAPFSIPNVGPPSVEMTLRPKEVTGKGSATLDVSMGLLDTLNEEFNAVLDYKCLADNQQTYTLQQRVTTKYELKRLAPAIQKYESAVDTSPASK